MRYLVPQIGKPSELSDVRCRILTIQGHECGILSNPPTILSLNFISVLLNQHPHCFDDLIYVI